MSIRLEAWPALMTRETAAAYIDGSLRDIDELRATNQIVPVGGSKRLKFRKSNLDAYIERLPEKTSKQK